MTPLLERDVERILLHGDARVVHQDVDRPERLLDLVAAALQLGSVGDVSLHADRGVSGSGDLGCSLVTVVLIAGDDRDAGTCSCQRARKLLAEPTRSTRDQRDPTTQCLVRHPERLPAWGPT